MRLDRNGDMSGNANAGVEGGANQGRRHRLMRGLRLGGGEQGLLERIAGGQSRQEPQGAKN
jgi:hypothetical protein